MNTLAAGIRFVDLEFQQRQRIIATAVLDGPAGPSLIDPGPSSCLPVLRGALEHHGVRIRDLESILLTHIHLDHAGATGTLVQENPGLVVYVHERGARHMIDPTRLLDSATRLYGDRMDTLWGPFVPVPAGNVKSLAGGERITAGGRDLLVAYTPGHASHHVSFFEPSSGIAFVGDTAGVRTGDTNYVLPPTPPPDIDLDIWKASVATIEAWNPSSLFLTHFGPAAPVRPHLRSLVDEMDAVAVMVRDSLSRADTEEEQFQGFAAAFSIHLRRRMSEGEAVTYERAAPIRYNWQGLVRYWRKKDERR